MMVVLSLSMVMRLGLAEIGDLHVLQLDAEVFGDGLAAGEDGDVFAAWPCGDRRSPAP